MKAKPDTRNGLKRIYLLLPYASLLRNSGFIAPQELVCKVYRFE